MDVRRDAGCASASDTTTVRRCSGSERFGIEPHDAPVDDFPRQPSQKDGFGRMCKPHWNQYPAGLARAAKVRKAAEQAAPGPTDQVPEPPAAKPRAKGTPRRAATTPAAGSQGDAG